MKYTVHTEMLRGGGWLAAYTDENRQRQEFVAVSRDVATYQALAAAKAAADRRGESFVLASDG